MFLLTKKKCSSDIFAENTNKQSSVFSLQPQDVLCVPCLSKMSFLIVGALHFSCPMGPLVTLSMQTNTIPFNGHKADDTGLHCYLLYICHFNSCALCSSYLCMHELFQIEPTIEKEITRVSQWLEANNFLPFRVYLSCLLFLWQSYGCVALFCKDFQYKHQYKHRS